ncbi:MAG TPA: hypothetical protein VFC68_02895 [Treponemataceae bacterium]|nr:hypothetical protein [Treponemataceae bacterium]
MGDKKNAKLLLSKAKKINPGDPHALVVEHRLEDTFSLDKKLLISDDSVPIIVEKAIFYYKNGSYAESAALFDKAFLAADKAYIEAYGPIRDTAWSLKDVQSSENEKSSLSLLNEKELTAKNMVFLIYEYSEILQNVIGARAKNKNEVYGQLINLHLFTPVSIDSFYKNHKVQPEKSISRIECARFLWNLYILKKGMHSEATMYSIAYRNNNFSQTPIPDVSVKSPDFDAVLGCIENELMELPDGINFYPYKKVSSLELLDWIKKL